MSNEAFACGALGFLLLIGGFVAYIYEVRHGWKIPFTDEWMYTHSTYPHRDLGMLFMVLGVVLIVVGGVLSSIKKPQIETTQRRVPLEQMCPKCGRLFPKNYAFCPYCEVKLGVK